MAKRKTFGKGQEVEVQREAGRCTWEPATYDQVIDDVPRSIYHWVVLPQTSEPFYVDSMTGERYDERDVEGRRFLTRKLMVPSVRIRAVKRKQMVDDRLKRRVKEAWPVDAKTRCECGHPFYLHRTNGNCGECPVNSRTGKSRCRRFKASIG